MSKEAGSSLHSLPKEVHIVAAIAGAAMTFMALHLLANQNPSMGKLVRKIHGGRPLRPHQAQRLTDGLNSIRAEFPPKRTFNVFRR